MSIIWTQEVNGEEVHHRLPSVWEICSDCRGHGKSSAHLGCFTQSEFAEAFDTPESQDDYFNGAYDRQCTTCSGTGKVQVIDRERIDSELLAEYDAERKAIDELEAEMAAERRYFAMCSGDWGY